MGSQLLIEGNNPLQAMPWKAGTTVRPDRAQTVGG